MRIHRDERGQTIILVALSLPLMLGFVGIATDVGALFKDKRTLQTAADAAAMAGALNLNYGSTAYNAAAQAAATSNGFTNGSNRVTVTIKDPPAWPASNYYNKTGYVEATITKVEPTIFLALFGYPSVTVLARAVATNQASGTGCLYTVGASGTTFTANGATLDAPTCGLVVESNDPTAMVVSGTSSLTLASIGVVGGYSGPGPPTVSPAPVANIAPESDPLNYLPQYSFTTTTTGRGRRLTTTYHVDCATGYTTACSNSPITVPGLCATTGGGVYNVTAGSTLTSGCYTALIFPTTGTVTLSPGLYIIDGGITFSGSNVTGTGVTLYYSGQLTFGTGTYNLSAPNDVTQLFNGVLFAESIADADPITFNGNAGSVVKGIVYAPGTNLTMSTTPPFTLDTDFVVENMTLNSGFTFTNYSSLSGITSPLANVGLVE